MSIKLSNAARSSMDSIFGRSHLSQTGNYRLSPFRPEYTSRYQVEAEPVWIAQTVIIRHFCCMAVWRAVAAMVVVVVICVR